MRVAINERGEKYLLKNFLRNSHNNNARYSVYYSSGFCGKVKYYYTICCHEGERTLAIHSFFSSCKAWRLKKSLNNIIDAMFWSTVSSETKLNYYYLILLSCYMSVISFLLWYHIDLGISLETAVFWWGLFLISGFLTFSKRMKREGWPKC